MNLFEIINYRHQKKYSKLNKKKLKNGMGQGVRTIKGLGLSCHLQSCSVRDLIVQHYTTNFYFFYFLSC